MGLNVFGFVSVRVDALGFAWRWDAQRITGRGWVLTISPVMGHVLGLELGVGVRSSGLMVWRLKFGDYGVVWGGSDSEGGGTVDHDKRSSSSRFEVRGLLV